MAIVRFKSMIVLGLILFLATGFLSLYCMQVNNGGRMINCPFMPGSTSFCKMSLTDHINQWQQMFSATQQREFFLSYFAMLCFALFAVFSLYKTSDRLQLHTPRNYFYQYTPKIKLFDHFALVFSRGIIHPQIYA